VNFPEIIGEDKFAIGRLKYWDTYGSEPTARIVLDATFEDVVTTPAILDTGAPWCILNPEDAAPLKIETRADCEPTTPLWVRGMLYSGVICRIPLTLQADVGESLTLEASVFIPTLKRGEYWTHPNFLGLSGFLNRIRFAVDPKQNHFYFGPMDDTNDL
jgi:hypothetical protein